MTVDCVFADVQRESCSSCSHSFHMDMTIKNCFQFTYSQFFSPALLRVSSLSKVSCLCGMNDICLRSLSTASPVIHSHTHTCALLFFIYSFYNLSLRSSTGELVHLSNIIWSVEQWGVRYDEKKSKSHVKDCHSSYNYTPSFRVSHTFLVVISSVWMSICTRLHLI